jgi:hypothetical protein
VRHVFEAGSAEERRAVVRTFLNGILIDKKKRQAILRSHRLPRDASVKLVAVGGIGVDRSPTTEGETVPFPAARRTANLQQAQEAHQGAIKRFCAIAPLRDLRSSRPRAVSGCYAARGRDCAPWNGRDSLSSGSYDSLETILTTSGAVEFPSHDSATTREPGPAAPDGHFSRTVVSPALRRRSGTY